MQRESGADNLRLLFDIYHLATNGDDVDRALASYADRIGHVQIADAPGRHEPGTGSLDIACYLDRLVIRGYAGYAGLEYTPSGTSAQSFGWLPREARGRRP